MAGLPKRPTLAQADNTRVVKKSRPSADMIEARMRSDMTQDAFDYKWGKLPLPTKSIESYDDTFLGNANVPQTKSTALPVGPTPPKSSNKISAEYQSEGTENMRSDAQVKSSSVPSTPTTTKTNWPPAVQSFDDNCT